MEKNAVPFALREFMVKCWRRHRDVPTRIDQLVDRAVDDLMHRKQNLVARMTKNKINGQLLVKVENLLDTCFEVADNLPEDSNEYVQILKEKVKGMKEKQDIHDTKLSNTQLRYAALKQKGKLSLTGRTKWQWANNELPETPKVLADQPSTLTEKTCEDNVGVQEVLASQCMESDSNVGAFTDTDAWVECVTCSKWRLLPRGVDATSLPADWTCSSGAAWRSNGLNCDIAADEDEDQNKDDEVLADEGDCHQPMVGAFMVRRVPVALLVEEDKWLRMEWGLRPCYTWKDGYSLYRCAAANRRTSKQQMLSDLLQFCLGV
jgi:hypothetical protein